MRADIPARKGTCVLAALWLGCSANGTSVEPANGDPGSPGDPTSAPLFVGASYPSVVSVKRGSDGTEVNRATWFEHGFRAGTNRMGRKNGATYDLGLRFDVPTLEPGQELAYARLILPATGGRVDSEVRLRIVGLAADDVEPFQSVRPSEHDITQASVAWTTSKNWLVRHNGSDRRRR